MMVVLNGVVMELQDCALPHLNGMCIYFHIMVIFNGVLLKDSLYIETSSICQLYSPTEMVFDWRGVTW